MKSVSVSELKANLSEVLKKVQLGESFVITYGKARTPVARLVPISNGESKKKRKDPSHS